MLKTSIDRSASVGDTLLAASRQVWLAGLGAAVVTRDWAEKEGGTVFRNLVREGTVVESRAVRIVGERLETSFSQANTMWKSARRTVTTTVKAYADTAAMLVRETIPASLPKVALPIKARSESRSVATRKAVRSHAKAARRAGVTGKRAKRTVKASAKRA